MICSGEVKDGWILVRHTGRMLGEATAFILGSVTFPTLFKFVSNSLHLIQDDYKRLDISIKIISAIQAVGCVLVGCLTMRYTEDDIVYSRFAMLDYYIYFWVPYFYYDAWALYQAYKVSDREIGKDVQSTGRVKRFLKSQPLMMVHHLVLPLIYGPCILLLRQGKGDYLIGCALLMETTIPFISTRNILLQLNMKHTYLYTVNGILLAISFGLARVYIWVYLVHSYSVYKQVSLLEAFLLLPRICRYVSTIFFFMNIHWFIKILFTVKRSIKEIYGSTVKLIQ